MPPDSGGKVKKRENIFPFDNLALLNLDFAEKKIAKKGKKKPKKEFRQSPTTLVE